MNGQTDTAVWILLVFIVVAAILWLAGVGRNPAVYPWVVLAASGMLVAIRLGAL